MRYAMRYLGFVSLHTLLALFSTAADAPPPSASKSKAAEPLFVHSSQCQACHNGLKSVAGEDVSIGINWRSSMMAHSAEDPYWQASLRREALVHPSESEHIQDECAACHMPMARYRAHTAGKLGEVFPNLPPLPLKSRNQQMAVDGVSCSICHQISSEGLGEASSFTAGFAVDHNTPLGERAAYGPYDTDKGRERVMSSVTELVPTESKHIQDSALCGSCHTLYTQTRNAAGEVVGELPEQMPYLEWRHSAYADRESCQSCHMPVVKEAMPITSVLGQSRTNLSRHVFRGGNFFMLELLNRHNAALKLQSLPQDLADSALRTREHLQQSTAEISIDDLVWSNKQLRATVSIANLAGHKLPTAYPSRRTWIYFRVRNEKGQILFASGKMNADGSIEGNDNDRDRRQFEPHYNRISSPKQVQIYEAIMVDPNDEVTTVLLSAIRYIKDNRILPDGFDKATADSDIAVQGRASRDENFLSGNDLIEYDIELPGADGPLTVVAELWYQPIAFRWARNLMLQPSEEAERFIAYYDSLSNRSAIVLARSSAEVR